MIKSLLPYILCIAWSVSALGQSNSSVIQFINNGEEYDAAKIEKEEIVEKSDAFFNQLLQFNGETSYIAAPKFNKDSIFTISFWFKSSSLLRRNCALVGITNHFWLRTTTNRELQFTQPSRIDNNTSGLMLTEENWYFVACRLKNRNIDLFLNGQLCAQFEWKGNMPTGESTFFIGKDTWREHFSGGISQFQYVNRPLSNQEIIEKHQKQRLKQQLNYGLIYSNGFEFRRQSEQETFTNIEKVDSKDGKGIHLNGDNSYIDFPQLKVDNAISFSGWVKCERPTERYGALLDSEQAFAFRVGGNGYLLFTLPQIDDLIANNVKIKPNQWSHVGFSYLEGKQLKLYFNRKLVKEFDIEDYPNAAKRLRIGNNLWNNFFKGEMDNIAIWNRIISDEEMFQAGEQNSEYWQQFVIKEKANNWWLYTLIGAVIFAIALVVKRRKANVKDEIVHLEEKPQKENEDILRATEIVKQHLNDSGFQVEQFAQAMNMSKTKLYNILKEHSGMSTKEFIRNIRMKKAAELLTTTDMPVTDIVFETGFESRAYFNKCFREKYQQTPTEYRKKQI
ncbi:helix-turn-helix domain-containing protein [Prolixibacteraceae bacterium JC049]|nr:helix-turn-helix domain-containing protein [Prolixibacteraceae bacterium JC049]